MQNVTLATAPTPMPQTDDRIQQRAQYIKDVMADRGLKATELVRLAQSYGVSITDDYMRKLVRGYSDLASASLPVREAIRKSLRLTADEWERVTGLATTQMMDPDKRPSGSGHEATGKLPLKFRNRPIRGDAEFPALSADVVVTLQYDQQPTTELVLTRKGEDIYLWFPQNIPSGHTVVGSYRGMLVAKYVKTDVLN